jgi:serine/threonine-protein kinase
VEPTITPELQEIIYRALERDPANRYPTAREFIHDLEHQDEVGVADREEMHNWKVRKTGAARKILNFVGLIMIPVVIFGLLFWFARKG